MEPGSSTGSIYSKSKVSSAVQKCFASADKYNCGRITGKELQTALIHSQGKTFSDETCRLMIALFDTDKSGTIDVYEFQHLYKYINQWIAAFQACDGNNSGYVEELELEQALRQMGYTLSDNFVKVLTHKTKVEQVNPISFDQFIVACVKMQQLTNAFRLKHRDTEGKVPLGFEEFMDIIVNNFQ